MTTTYRVADYNKADTFTVRCASGTTPINGIMYVVNSSGYAQIVDGSNMGRPYMCVGYQLKGTLYYVTLTDKANINSNESADFTIGSTYYSDNDGTISTSATTTGWIVGYAVSGRQIRLFVERIS